jgi:hypothetical protein
VTLSAETPSFRGRSARRARRRGGARPGS